MGGSRHRHLAAPTRALAPTRPLRPDVDRGNRRDLRGDLVSIGRSRFLVDHWFRRAVSDPADGGCGGDVRRAFQFWPISASTRTRHRGMEDQQEDPRAMMHPIEWQRAMSGSGSRWSRAGPSLKVVQEEGSDPNRPFLPGVRLRVGARLGRALFPVDHDLSAAWRTTGWDTPCRRKEPIGSKTTSPGPMRSTISWVTSTWPGCACSAILAARFTVRPK
jgi:hypothetical protein